LKTTGEHILNVQNLSVWFSENGPHKVVQDISFSLSAHETLALVGESGSGKSLTALALMGLLPPQAKQSGTIEFYQGTPLHQLSPKAWRNIRGKEIGMIFQEPMSALNPIMKVGQQLVEAILTHERMSRREAKQKAVEWLSAVQLPNPALLFQRYPHQISGGQKQRVMIAMAMCHHPRILIADEPTTALDVTVQKGIIQLMQTLQKTYGIAIIFITHDLSLAASMADKVMVMQKSRMVEFGNAKQVLLSPQHIYTQALVSCKPNPYHKRELLPTIDSITRPEEFPLSQSTIPHKVISAGSNPLLSVQNLTVNYTQKASLTQKAQVFTAVNGVSFSIHAGETVGIVGESGCGKSTLSRALMGLQAFQQGSILFPDQEITDYAQADWKRVRLNMQMIFQDPYSSLNPRMRIGEILTEPMIVHKIILKERAQQEAIRLLESVQLPASAYKRYPHEFSGGQRQRIAIARALALRPKILICDECVSALDLSIQAQILNLLKLLQKEFQLSYLFISHDLSVVHHLSDRILVMHAGSFVEKGHADDILFRPQHPYTQKLISSANFALT